MKIIENDLKNKTVCVALSGGSDSMCLISYLILNRNRLNVNIKAVNVEHGIRGAESLNDTKFVENFCKNNDIECFLYKVDVPSFAKKNCYGLEQAARILRYDCFEKVLSENKTDFIATAHHKNDNTETVLFNIFRGSGLNGAKGIRYKSGKIIRPMLETEKSEILDFIKINNIKYVTDKSNLDTSYKRNYLRHEIIPLIEKGFVGATDNISRFSFIAGIENDFMDNLANKLVKTQNNNIKIEFCDEKALFFRAVIIALKQAGKIKDYTLKNIISIYNLQKSDSGATCDITDQIKAVKDYDGISIIKCTEKNEIMSEYDFKAGEFLFFKDKINIKKADINNLDKSLGLFFDADKLPEGCIIRQRKNGDYFTKFGGGTKKLKDYLIDKKILRRERDRLAVIAKNSEVFIVCGYQISDKIKVDKNTEMVYNITITKGEE